jgi:hypothetical protein
MTDLREQFAPMVQIKRLHVSLQYTYLYWEKTHYLSDKELSLINRVGPVTNTEKLPYACVATHQPTPGGAVYVGVSRCSEQDQFRRVVARDIAAGRAKKREMCTIDQPWAMRLKSGGSAYAEFEEALGRMLSRKPISYTQAVNALFEFCREAGIPSVMYGVEAYE